MGFLDAFIGGIFSVDQQQSAQRYDKAEAERAYKRSLDQRDYMNRYNSPQEQMQRLKEAGLNPNLAYGTGTTGTQPNAPQYQPQKGRPAQINPKISLQDYANIGLIQETTRQRKLENDYFENTVGEKTLQMQLKTLLSTANYEKALNINNRYRKDIDLLNLSIEIAKQNISLAEAELKARKAGVSYKDWVFWRQFFVTNEKMKRLLLRQQGDTQKGTPQDTKPSWDGLKNQFK